MSDSERSAEPIRRHDEPPSHLHPLSPTRAQRGASRLTPAVRPPRTPARLERPYLAPHQQPTGDGQRAQRFAYSEARRASIISSVFIADESEPRSESTAARRLPALNPSPPRTIPPRPPSAARLERSPPRAPSAADGWRAASAAVRLFGGTTRHHRILDSYYRRERTAERVARWPSAARFELQPATNHPYLAPHQQPTGDGQ